MPDESAIYNWIVTGIVGAFGLLGTIAAWLMNRSVSRLDSDIEAHRTRLDGHEEKIHSQALDLANFKTHVSDNYAKDASVQSSLARIHDRIDQLPKDIISLLRKEQ